MQNNLIPKIIHYCWLSNDPIPENLQKCMNSWKEKLPDYELMLWNFDRFDKKSSLWVEQAFDNKKYAFAADYIRLYAIYNYGGIYLDMDIEVLKTFDSLLNRKLMIAFENPEKTGIEAGCFGAEKNNKFIGDCFSYYNNREFIKKNGEFDILPLPKIMFSFLKNHPEINIKDIGDWHCFTNKSYKTGEISTTSNSYTIHHFAGSWTSLARKNYDEKRHKYYSKHNKFVAKILSEFALVECLLKEGGIKRLLSVIINKIENKD